MKHSWLLLFLEQYRKVCWGGAQITPAVTLSKIWVFHWESSLKGLLRPWRSWLIKQCHLQWITLPLNVWVGVYVSACWRACLFVCACASVRVSLIFEQSHSPIIISSCSSQLNNVSQSQGRVRQMCSGSQSRAVCYAIALWYFFGGGGCWGGVLSSVPIQEPLPSHYFPCLLFLKVFSLHSHNYPPVSSHPVPSSPLINWGDSLSLG